MRIPGIVALCAALAARHRLRILLQHTCRQSPVTARSEAQAVSTRAATLSDVRDSQRTKRPMDDGRRRCRFLASRVPRPGRQAKRGRARLNEGPDGRNRTGVDREEVRYPIPGEAVAFTAGTLHQGCDCSRARDSAAFGRQPDHHRMRRIAKALAMPQIMTEREEHSVRTSSKWRRARREHLRRFPLCAACEREGQTIAATVVHHVHRVGHNREKMFGTPLESLCALHHDRDAQAREKAGKKRGHRCAIRPDGFPVSRDHAWWK